MQHRECPECGSDDTEAVNTDVRRDAITRTRICGECPTQFLVVYGDPIITETASLGEGE